MLLLFCFKCSRFFHVFLLCGRFRKFLADDYFFPATVKSLCEFRLKFTNDPLLPANCLFRILILFYLSLSLMLSHVFFLHWKDDLHSRQILNCTPTILTFLDDYFPLLHMLWGMSLHLQFILLLFLSFCLWQNSALMNVKNFNWKFKSEVRPTVRSFFRINIFISSSYLASFKHFDTKVQKKYF